MLLELWNNIKEQVSPQAVAGVGLIFAYFALMLGAAGWRVWRQLRPARPPRYKPRRGDYF